MTSAAHRIAQATAVAGTLDILAATVMTLARGREVPAMLRYVASGPFPPATGWDGVGAMLGLAVHYALMAIMSAMFVLAADRHPALKARPVAWGVVYGIVTYVAMNLIVVPLRFGTGLPPSLVGFASQLTFHILLVGVPVALIARR